MSNNKLLRKALGVTIVSASAILTPLATHRALAIYQGNPTEVTLNDVISCLVVFQNPGVTLTAEQLAAGVGGVLGTVVDPLSFNPLPTTDTCNFINDGAGTSLPDVISTLVAFQNPGVTLTADQLATGINGVLGGTLTGADVTSVPPSLPNQANASSLTLKVFGAGGETDTVISPKEKLTVVFEISNPQGNPTAFKVPSTLTINATASYLINPLLPPISQGLGINVDLTITQAEAGTNCAPGATVCTITQAYNFPDVPKLQGVTPTLTGTIKVTVDATELLVPPVNGLAAQEKTVTIANAN